MHPVIVELLRSNNAELTDRMVARLVEEIPRYASLNRDKLHENVDGLIEALIVALEADDNTGLLKRLFKISQERSAQGISSTDFLKAIHLAFPVMRSLVREAGPDDDPAFKAGFSDLERRMHDVAILAADSYSKAMAAQLRSKNQELNRLVQRLKAQEQVLNAEVHATSKALESASEFNQRVIDAMASGVAVAGLDLTVSLWSERFAEITGIPTEQALGRKLNDVIEGISGLDFGRIVRSVRDQGRFPLSKMTLVFPDNARRSVLVRAERLIDAEGEPEGTVCVIDDVSERELLIDSFSRYVSRDLVDKLLARGRAPALEGRYRSVSILFADIRGFTTLAEGMEPLELLETINSYFHTMVEAVYAQGGFIDKFVGDKVMGVFAQGKDPAVGAVAAAKAARDIQRRIRALREERARANKAPIEVGIGVNTGKVMLGNIGSELRMDFTVVGDPVNVADRLQSLAKAGETLLGEETVRLIGAAIEVSDLEEVTVKGRKQPVMMARLLAE